MHKAAWLVCALLATSSAGAANGREVVIGTAKGALKGAFVCPVPAIIGANSAGAIGLRIGAAITFVCLPFGVTLGAISGAANTGLPGVR